MRARVSRAVIAALAASLSVSGVTISPRWATATSLPITITMPAAPNATMSNAQYSTQDVWTGVLTSVQTPPSGISPLQRLADLNPPNFRIHAGTDGGLAAEDLPFNAPYTSSDNLHVNAWDFNNLNSLVANTVGRTSGSTMLDVRYAPDNMFAGTGPLGGNGSQGALLDQTYVAFATYMANLVKYYNTSSPPAGATPARPAGIGPIHYWEIWNEPDYPYENPRIPPSLPPPSLVTLTSVSVPGGTLVPGTTYSYRVTPLSSSNQEGIASTASSITLATGSNAVNITWNSSTNLSRVAAAYGLYGRTGTAGQLVFVGKDNPAGLSWTDKGTIAPGGAPPTDPAATVGGPVFSPLQYKALWDKVVPAMKAVDPTIKVVGPVCVGPISMSPVSVITTAVNTGPGDLSYLDTRDYVQILMTSTNKPDVISYHGYGGFNGAADSDSSLMSAINQIAADVTSNILPYSGTTPIWHTEANVNSAEDTSFRPALAFGAAWQASLFAKLAPIGVSTIHQYTYTNSPGFGLIAEAGTTVPGAVEGNPYLPYWVEYSIDHLFVAGAKILPVANVPAGMDVLAVANPPDFASVKVLVVNRQVPATNTSVPVLLSGANATATRVRVIDSATNLVTGPVISSLGAVQTTNVQMNGYSVALVEFDTAAGPLVPTITGITPGSGPPAGGTSVSITGIGFTGATSVKFGVTAASSFAVNSDSHITATSPSGAGTVDISVTTPAGASAASIADHFTYVPQSLFALSTDQYRLTGSDGVTWQAIDRNKLSLAITPASNLTAILGGNADLWTVKAGLNQDLAIAVSVNGGANQVLGWKESGGWAGTYSPNAAFVQTVYPMTAGTSYVFTLQWKTNVAEGSGTVLAGAGTGSGGFSPTSLSLHALPAGINLYTAVSTQQYNLPNSDGSKWQDIDSTNLKLALTTGATSSTAVIGGNADLWTANVGVNQDLGIFISGGAYGAGQLVAWKESGGFAGTFSPNAAFVHTIMPLAATTSYTITLRWKSNAPTGGTIYAAAGPRAPFSPTRLTAELIPTGANPYSAVSTTQYVLRNSDGQAWKDLDPTNLKLSVTPVSDTLVLLGANSDLWTENATFNQDLAISVSTDGGPDVVIAWKESGGFAGTFSPNAAFVQSVLAISSGHTYVFKLKWKTNKAQSAGNGVRAGAGANPTFSPTRLTAELISG